MNLTHSIPGLARPRHGTIPAGSLLARLHNWLATRAETRAARRQFSREMQQLHRFTDGELRDVGLSRSDFMAIEAGHFSRD